MSLVISLYVREGIVMAADSRATLNMVKKEKAQSVSLSVAQSDSVRKLFLLDNQIGISAFGEAGVKGVPISGYVDSFLSGLKRGIGLERLSEEILKFFSSFSPRPKTGFHVGGYEGTEQILFQVLVDKEEVRRVNPAGTQGAAWAGESDILTRLLQPLHEERNGKFNPLPYFQIPWGFFTLQDAVDFAEFAIKATADAMRFMPRPKTVGGPIDILVVTPEKGFWVNRKELNVR